MIGFEVNVGLVKTIINWDKIIIKANNYTFLLLTLLSRDMKSIRIDFHLQLRYIPNACLCFLSFYIVNYIF